MIAAETGNPRWFLHELFAAKPEELYLLLWTRADKRSRWFRDIDAAASAVKALAAQDVYVGVGLSSKDYGPAQRCPSEEIAGIVGLWADLDLRSEAHDRKALPATIQDALAIIPELFPPTFVVATGNGAHAWWLFKEPYIFAGDEERKAAARLIARWQTLLRLNAAARGWAFDRLADLARVLRIPGTTNAKDPANPKPVTLFSRTGRRYNPGDFEEWLEETSVPDPAAEDQAARDWAERFKDKPLVINLNARIPQETIERWMEADARFRATWLRQRNDLRDQSQSGYDMALADFGVDAGLEPQQIVDLIVHHRHLGGQRPRTRVDYYQRTIAKALKRTTSIDPNSILGGAAQPKASQSPSTNASQPKEEAQKQRDPNTAKAILCERISQMVGIRIVRIVKITGKEPSYHIQLEGATVELPSTAKFIDQNSVRLAIASATNLLIPRIKPKDWDLISQMMFAAVVEQPGGPETELEGAIRIYLERYLADVSFIAEMEGQPMSILARPMVIDGQVAVNSTDLQQYVTRVIGHQVSVKSIASMLTAIGAQNILVRTPQGSRQSRWLLPLSEFSPGDYIGQKGKLCEVSDCIN
jgi:hypothetical protein